MKLKSKILLLIIILLIALFLKAYPFLDSKLEGFLISYETIVIDRVIDGDTVKSNGTSIRLLGINTPEKGEIYYLEAKEFLEELVLNKSVRLEFGKEREDRYERTLAYLYINNQNINLKLVENGLANIYFPSGKDVYYNDFLKAWENCNENLCEVSEDKCFNCIKLKEFDKDNEIIILENTCSFNCELTMWSIKDEGRKKFVFPEFILENNKEVKIIVDKGEDNLDNLFWERNTYVWTNTGDSLFLRDDNEKLVLWDSY